MSDRIGLDPLATCWQVGIDCSVLQLWLPMSLRMMHLELHGPGTSIYHSSVVDLPEHQIMALRGKQAQTKFPVCHVTAETWGTLNFTTVSSPVP